MYEFNIESFFFGIVILAIGAGIVVFHQKLADNLGSGINSYDRFKLWGLITCGVGFAVMTSIHSILLNFIASSLLGL